MIEIITLLFLATSVGAVGADGERCQARLANERVTRGIFPLGLTLRTESPDLRVREAARKTLDFRADGVLARYDDSLIVPHYVFDSDRPFEIRELKPSGWVLALFDDVSWVAFGVVAMVEGRPAPHSFQEAGPFGDLWSVLHQLSAGFVKTMRRVVKSAPVYEMRLVSGPAQHVRAIWLHGATDDWFVVSKRRRLDVLDAWNFENLIDASTLNAKHGMRNYIPE